MIRSFWKVPASSITASIRQYVVPSSGPGSGLPPLDEEASFDHARSR